LMGVFVHDIGKVDELSYQRDLAYTDEGQLIGHPVIAVGLLEAKVREAEKLSGEPIPEETVLRLKHMLVSHHGEYEYGSPKLPMTLEAVALYYLDNLDAKLNAFDQLIRADPNVDSPWTHYHANISRKLYKGKAKQS
jgi:3'-5' exoribonuclease